MAAISIPDNWTDSPTRVAADIYRNESHNFTFDAVSSRTGIEVDHLRSAYRLKSELLRAYYVDAWHRYVEMESSVPEFAQYTLAEKLTTLVFSLCDEFELVEGFAAETYGMLIHDGGSDSMLANGVRSRVALYLANDESVSMFVKYLPGDTLERIISGAILRLILERVNDTSADKEKTSALSDKVTTLIQSAVYTGFIDHLVDLARYMGITYVSKK